MSSVLLSEFDTKLKDMKKPLEFVPAKTVKDAEKWLMDNDIVDIADFGKINDVSIVNAYAESMHSAVMDFPKLRENQKFVGSIQAHNRYIFEEIKKEYIRKLTEKGYTESQAEHWARVYIKKPKSASKSWRAISWSGTWNADGISHNEAWKDADKLIESMKNSVESGWHPVGCDTIKALVDHEIGHQLDALLDFYKDDAFLSIWEELNSKNKIALEVSKYAESNKKEFIAECWAEYKNNPTCRGTAKLIGELIEIRYRSRFSN